MDVQSIKDSRKKGVVCFTRFCLDKKYHKDCMFCFFEGEDRKYYGSRIEKYTNYDYEHIICYDCGGKEHVLTAYELISQKHEYDNVKKAFFIDRDYCPSSIRQKEIYETPCYSIENFYVSTTAFSKILVREFGINRIDKDYEKCINDYNLRISEYNNLILVLNAWLSCQRKKGMNHFAVRLSDFKIAKYFICMTIDSVRIKETIDVSFMESHFSDVTPVEQKELEKEIEFFRVSDKTKMFRGKFELEFFKKILSSLLEHNRNSTYFSEKRNSISFDAHNNTLSSFSEYADTPKCLIDFLSQYKN